MRILFPLIAFCTAGFLFSGCGETSSETSRHSEFTNLNITILIDLSDRISVKKNGEQIEKDIECIRSVVAAFKAFINTKGTVHSEDRIKVVFYPNNLNGHLEEIASALSIDLGEAEFGKKRRIYESLDSVYTYNLQRLYSVAAIANSFNGSDIFNFFKHRISDDCIDGRNNFRNILVILSDGYMYNKNSTARNGNRYSYILQSAEHVNVFRNKPGFTELFEQGDYGFINTGSRLEGLSVLALEFAPYREYAFDFDIQKLYWEKWFEEQGIMRGNFKIVKSDLSALNKPIIKNFILRAGER